MIAASRQARRQRAEGSASVVFARRAGATRLAHLEQSGALRVLFPRPEPGAAPAAVLANIGGGVAGGDRLDVAIAWSEGADATVTTQAAEKVYRAVEGPAWVETRLDVASGATAHWLPQEAILFDGARLERRLDIELAEDARLLACESIVFGRTARGERVRAGGVFDRWRVRRGGRLIFADALELENAVAERLDRRAVGAGACACATLLFSAPDAERRLDDVRALLASGGAEAGASAFDGIIVVRLAAQVASLLRRDLRALMTLLGERPAPRFFAF
jgi:urease accessory protein